MKSILRPILTLLFCIVMCICLMPAAYAYPVASGTCGAQGDNLTWILSDDGVLTISGTGEMADYSLGRAPWFNTRLSINSLTIENGVTRVGNYAFYYCNNLIQITFSKSVTTIGSYAFDGCTKLPDVVLPERVQSIGFAAFWGCSNLTNVTIPVGVTSIEDGAFSGCSRLKSVTIPETLTNISTSAFQNCASLTSVSIPNSVTSIGGYAFSGCSGLTDVIIPNSVTIIGNSSFFSCTGLTSVEIPNSVTSIGDAAFSGCTSLTRVSIPDSVTSVGSSAFSRCTSLTSATIPYSVTIIDEYAFSDCNSLEIVTISEGVVDIGNYAFVGCNSLKSITIPSSITKIGGSAFSDCSSLTNVIIPEGVVSIGNSAFSYCTGLESVTISGSVIYVGDAAFSDCSALTSVTMQEGVVNIGIAAFSGCTSLTQLTIPESVTNIGEDAFSKCGKIKDIKVAANNPNYCDVDGVLFDKNISTILFFPRAREGDYVIPSGVKTINFGAFLDCSGLTGVTIPESVTSIGNYAFYGCVGLTSVTIPSSMTKIPYGTFCGCSSLTSARIPSSVMSIEERAFYNCYNLTNVFYEGSEIQWKSIAIESNNDALQNARLFYNGDTSVLCIINFEPNGGSGTMLQQTVESGIAETLNFNSFIREDFAFVGWNTKSDGSGLSYFDGETVVFSHDTTLYAQWEQVLFTIMFNPNGGYGTMESQRAVKGKPITLSKNTFVHEEYTFDCWNTCADGRGTTFIDGDTIILSCDVTLFAQWVSPDLILPASLTMIGNEAFTGGAFTYAKLPENAVSIGWHAFADCPNLAYIYIPASTTQIDEAAFGDLQGLTILGKAGSTAEAYAQNHHFNFTAVP